MIDMFLSLLHQGQADVDPRTTLRCIADFDGALMFVDNLPDDGQSKTGTAGLRGDVGLEDARQQLDRKSRPVVRYEQPRVAPGALGDDFDDSMTPFEGILRIAQEIVDDLP